MSINPEIIEQTRIAAEDIEANADSRYLTVIDAHHEFDKAQGRELPQYRVCVTIEDTASMTRPPTFCHPIADYAREKWDLELIDTITNWIDETITLRLTPNTDST